MWDILLQTEDALAGSIFATTSMRIQTEYMGTRKAKVTLHGVPLYISGDNLSFFFAQFGEMADVSSVKCKSGIATGDIKIMVTVTRKNFFMNNPNGLICGGRPIYVVGRQPLY